MRSSFTILLNLWASIGQSGCNIWYWSGSLVTAKYHNNCPMDMSLCFVFHEFALQVTNLISIAHPRILPRTNIPCFFADLKNNYALLIFDCLDCKRQDITLEFSASNLAKSKFVLFPHLCTHLPWLLVNNSLECDLTRKLVPSRLAVLELPELRLI